MRLWREDGDEWEEEGGHIEWLKMNEPDDEEKEYVFNFDRWFGRIEGNKDVVQELPVVVEGEDTLPGKIKVIIIKGVANFVFWEGGWRGGHYLWKGNKDHPPPQNLMIPIFLSSLPLLVRHAHSQP